jgi:hypothetical protein
VKPNLLGAPLEATLVDHGEERFEGPQDTVSGILVRVERDAELDGARFGSGGGTGVVHEALERERFFTRASGVAERLGVLRKRVHDFA